MPERDASLNTFKLFARTFTDRFLHATILENAELLNRARVLVIVLLLLTPQHVALLLAVMTPALAESRTLATLFAVAGCLTLPYILAKLKWQGSFNTCRNLFVIYGSVVVIFACVITGGPMHSAAAQVLVIVSVIAFFLGGANYGLLVSTILLAFTVFLVALQASGVQFPQMTPDTIDSQDREIVLIVNFVFLVTLAFAYETVSLAVRRARDHQHTVYEELARTDTLTGLLNRRAFDEAVARRIRDYAQNAQTFALCYIDLDRFKPINDQFGHEVGDAVLCEIAARIRELLGPRDFAARRGGDEFMIFLAGVTPQEIAASYAGRISQLLQQPVDTSIARLQVGGSLGFAVFPDHARTLQALTSLADHAMYDAKKLGTHWKIAAPG